MKSSTSLQRRKEQKYYRCKTNKTTKVTDMENKYTFFEHKYPTISIEHAVERCESFSDFEKSFSEELLNEDIQISKCIEKMLINHKIGAATASHAAGLATGYVGLLQNGKKTNPSRETLIKICIACHASIDETQELLKVAGCQPLYVRRKRDVVIWFGIKKGFDITKIDDELYARGLKTLNKE